MISFPKKLLEPIKDFLSREEKRLEKSKKTLAQEDPFEDVRRLTDNAASDADAAEQAGHERITALKKELDRKLIQVRKALTMIKVGRYGTCEECSRMIDTDRLMIYPEATFCVKCKKKEK
ncbi:MAG TPA: TraR/DksA C4-type zinc finger protein [Candidatus Bathyarchaeia archaeon]|nr:TraR/DksA C4-type zinc finger protein [Candidatus Bathyarchaeia archaeon]